MAAIETKSTLLRKAYAEYHKAMKEHGLDDINDGMHNCNADYMHDAFLAGFGEGFNKANEIKPKR